MRGLVPGLVVLLNATVIDTAVGQERIMNVTMQLRPSTSCRGCTVRLVPEVALGAGSALFGGVTRGYVRRDSRGRYYHTSGYSPSTFLVFDSSGDLLQSVGRRGTGPGEYSSIGRIVPGAGDTIHVFDLGLRSHTVLTPDYRMVRSMAIGARVSDVAEVAPGSLVVSADMRMPYRFGYPMHLLDASGLGLPLGGTEAIADKPAPGPLELSRRLRRQSDTTVWAGHVSRYAIDLWSTDGRLLQRLTREVGWFDVKDRGTLEGRLNPTLRDIEVDESGLIWALFMVRSRRWRELATFGPEGAPGLRNLVSRTGDIFDLRESALDVIDPVRGEVLATLRSERLIESFAGPGRLVIYEEDAMGVPRLQVYRVELDRPTGGSVP
jgi:hypothetical protein